MAVCPDCPDGNLSAPFPGGSRPVSPEPRVRGGWYMVVHRFGANLSGTLTYGKSHDTTNPKYHRTVMPTMRRTTITVSKRTKNELFNLKTEESDTYDDVVRRLIRERERDGDE